MSSEDIQVSEVFLVGRVVQGPTSTGDGRIHYLLDTGLEKPLHLIAQGKPATSLSHFIGREDEMSVEGHLEWVEFPNTGLTLVVKIRFASYGRKARTNREVLSPM